MKRGMKIREPRKLYYNILRYLETYKDNPRLDIFWKHYGSKKTKKEIEHDLLFLLSQNDDESLGMSFSSLEELQIKLTLLGFWEDPPLTTIT